MQHKTKTILIIALIFLILTVNVQAQSYFVGSKNSDVYHYSWCHYVDRIKSENKVYFSSAEDAQNRGYRPCKVCNPPIPELPTIGLAMMLTVVTGIAVMYRIRLPKKRKTYAKS